MNLKEINSWWKQGLAKERVRLLQPSDDRKIVPEPKAVSIRGVTKKRTGHAR